MSKRDIQVVCELAAHLAKRSKRVQTENGGETLQSVWDHKAETCAADAMKLQRLGRSARNAERRRWAKQGNGVTTADKALGYVMETANGILVPYGLHAQIRGDYLAGPILHILGLPGNTLGGNGEGFGI